MDPEKLNSIYSKVICSPAITRNSLSRKIWTQPTIDNRNDEDDIQFFDSLKKKIDNGSLKCLQNKYKSTKSYGTRKRKYNFNEKITNIIERFEEAREHKDHIEVHTIKLHSQTKEICENNTGSCVHNNKILKSVNMNVNNECCMLSRDYSKEEFIQKK
ncbi:hypothetical protein KPH14_009583 [Odynerus spinipes]|uniref:Uncharacterized protein n=1 Tax=Odynerus spinipes TaxID=1348599 RepID=A0AAD9RQ10_9HYME|nr:hypothetical protein KPH14_009583 [Odynerus spinipes]